jgi:hypothetical protein
MRRDGTWRCFCELTFRTNFTPLFCVLVAGDKCLTFGPSVRAGAQLGKFSSLAKINQLFRVAFGSVAGTNSDMDVASGWNTFDARRRDGLIADLRFALPNIRDRELRDWAKGIPAIGMAVTRRRGSNLKMSAVALWGWMKSEGSMARDAWRAEAIGAHLGQRTRRSIGAARDLTLAAREIAAVYGAQVLANPRTEAPVLVAGVIGLLAGSGGLDGDGGIPDLDLLGGIGAHRSLLTHTFVAGVVAETLVRAAADLATRTHLQLPTQHDKLWDALVLNDSRIVNALCAGVSAGLSYHFAVDATADAGGAYASLKGVISATADNTLQGANAVIEGNDAARRMRQQKRSG